jgi:multimeric flavodoxin WrbA
MKIIAFNSSPRGINSNTQIMVDCFLEGAKQIGAEIEHVPLSTKRIQHCNRNNCVSIEKSCCKIKDDMQELYPKAINADILLLATPLYGDSVTGVMKDFIDRLIVMGNLPYFEKDENGEFRHRIKNKRMPKLMVISNSGYPEKSQFQALKIYINRIARNLHADIVAEIYLGGGEILRLVSDIFSSDFITLKPFVEKYKNLLRRAGEEVVKYQKITPELQKELEIPIIPHEKLILIYEWHYKKAGLSNVQHWRGGAFPI